MIYCPKCGTTTKIRDCNGTNRRRTCDSKDCGHKFSTREMLVEDVPANTETVQIPLELYQAFEEVFNQMRKRTLLKAWGVKPLKGNN